MLVSVAQAQIFLLALTRVLAVIIHIPVMGGNSIPTHIRLGLGIILTAVIIKWDPLPATADTLGLLPLTFAIVQELIIGTFIGFAADLTFSLFQIAGETMSTSSGFNAAKTMNPTFGESGSALDQLFVIVASLIFLIVNGHHTVILAIQRTFVLIPVNTALPVLSGERAYRMVGEIILAGIQLALPVMATLLLTDLILGLLSRVAPQIQVFFLGIPLKMGLGLLVFGMTLASLIPLITDRMSNLGNRMLGLLGG